MVLKKFKWVHNAKIRSCGLDRSQLGKYQKIGPNGVLKGVNMGTQ